MNLNQLQIEIHAVLDRKSPGKQAIQNVLDAMAEVIERHFQESPVAAETGIPLPKIGKLVVRPLAARAGRNPRTGETLTIPARRKVEFRPSKSLKAAVNMQEMDE